MAIEFTQRSTIDGYPQGAESAGVWSLALKAREAGNAFHAHLRQAAGSAGRVALEFSRIFTATLALIAVLELEIIVNARIRLDAEVDMRIKEQSRIICISGKDSANLVSHAQFAVSQVARKAIHWQPTDCDCDRNSNMAIEFTQRSTIDGYPQGAEAFKFRRLRAL